MQWNEGKRVAHRGRLKSKRCRDVSYRKLRKRETFFSIGDLWIALRELEHKAANAFFRMKLESVVVTGFFVKSLFFTTLTACTVILGGTPSTSLAASLVLNPGDDVNALTASLQAGDEIVFNDGVYTLTQRLDWTGEGSEDRPIVLRAADNASPVLQYEYEGGGYFVQVYDASYFRIEGLTLAGGTEFSDPSYGGLVISNSRNIEVSNVEIRDFPATGLYLSNENLDIVIEHTAIHDILDGYGLYIGVYDGSYRTTGSRFVNNWIYAIGGASRYGIYIAPGSYANTISDNNIHGIENRGIGLAQYTVNDASLENLNVIERNAIWNVGDTGLQVDGSALVQNNLIFDVGAYGILSRPADDDDSSRILVINNSIEGSGDWAIYHRHRSGTYALVNNILCNPVGYAFLGTDIDETNAQNISLLNNVACGLVDVYDGLEDGFIAGNGLSEFTDASNFDFWPSEGSTLIDRGDASTYPPSDDFNGVSREGGAPDIGAYERTAGSNPGWIIQEGFKTFPSDAQNEVNLTETGCGACSHSGRSPALPFESLIVLLWMVRRKAFIMQEGRGRQGLGRLFIPLGRGKFPNTNP